MVQQGDELMLPREPEPVMVTFLKYDTRMHRHIIGYKTRKGETGSFYEGDLPITLISQEKKK